MAWKSKWKSWWWREKDESSKEGMKPETTQKDRPPASLFCRENTSRLNGARYSLLFLLISFSVARTKTDCHVVNPVSFASIRLLFSFHSQLPSKNVSFVFFLIYSSILYFYLYLNKGNCIFFSPYRTGRLENCNRLRLFLGQRKSTKITIIIAIISEINMNLYDFHKCNFSSEYD